MQDEKGRDWQDVLFTRLCNPPKDPLLSPASLATRSPFTRTPFYAFKITSQLKRAFFLTIYGSSWKAPSFDHRWPYLNALTALCESFDISQDVNKTDHVKNIFTGNLLLRFIAPSPQSIIQRYWIIHISVWAVRGAHVLRATCNHGHIHSNGPFSKSFPSEQWSFPWTRILHRSRVLFKWGTSGPSYPRGK